MKKLALLSLALALAVSVPALAASDYDFDGKVVCVQPEYVTAPIGGTVAAVPVLAGEVVAAGDALAELNTTKVYAPASGTVTGVFCVPGDSVSEVTARYDALLFIEPDSKYRLSASTENAYNASENKYIHVGETLYLACSDGTHTGTGFVTSVDGTSYDVEVTDGSFYMGETVSAYRNSGRSSKSRVGRGSIERISNIAVTGASSGESSGGSSGSGGGTGSSNSGGNSKSSVASVSVSNGDHVSAGDLLLETLSGEFDGRYCTGSTLVCDRDGILAALNATVGASVSKGDVIATIYPREKLQLEVDINEADLPHLSVGDAVQISFTWNEDSDDAPKYAGTVARVLYTAAESGGQGDGGDSAAYAAYIDFEADDGIRLGMTATVRPVSAELPYEEEEED